MARIFTEGFEAGDTLSLTLSGGGITSAGKRTGTYSCKLGNVVSGNYVQRTIAAAVTEIYIRFAYQVTNAGSETQFFQWVNGTTNAGTLRTTAIGAATTLKIYDGTTLRATSPIVAWNTYEWHVIEIRIKIAAAPNGIFQVKFDGTLVIDFAGATNNQASINNFRWYSETNSDSERVDDIAFNDTTGGSDNAWPGDGGVLAAMVPNGAGTYTDLIASTGNAYQCIDEIPYNSTDYVYESTVDKKSVYAMAACPALPSGASIQRVWVEAIALQTAADGNKIATLVRGGGVDTQGSDQSLTLAYAKYKSAEYLLDPADSAAWTTAKLDAYEAGVVVR